MHSRWAGIRGQAALGVLLVVLVLALLIRKWVCIPVLISGNSMLPTLRSGQVLLVNKLAYITQGPRRGDVVAIWTGRDLIIKRVVGLPGEEVAAYNSAFCVNGKTLPEPYVAFRDYWNIEPGKIDPGQFVVSGDNRSLTLVAVVAKERIVGRLVY